MKRKLWIMLALAVVLTALCCGAALADPGGSCGDNVTWTLTDAGALTISGSGDMTNYYSRSSVPWYNSRSSITSITIESNVTSIGLYAFCDCSGVTSITIPVSVTRIGYMSFNGCSGLTEAVILNRDAEIGDSDYDVFHGCSSGFTLRGFTGSTAETYAGNAGHSFANPKCGSNLTWDLSSGGNLTISGSGQMTAFALSTSAPWYSLHATISSLQINDGVTSISRHAFRECTKLTKVVIPISVTNIGYRAFKDCSKLSEVTICNSETVIGDSDYDVFDGCHSTLALRGWPGSTAETYAAAANLPFVSLGSTSGQIGDNVNYSINPQTGKVSITGTGSMWNFDDTMRSPLSNNKALNSVVIGSGVTGIGDGAFSSCAGLTNVTIPNSVTSIGHEAFNSCTGLTSITIPNSVTSIGDFAFRYCTSLTSVTIPTGVTKIAYATFADCTSLTSVTIPNSVTSIGDRAFSSCTGLTSVTIPNSVTSIGGWAFDSCTGLKSVTIPNSVTSIGDSAFSSCTGLTSVTIPNSVTSIGDFAFSYCTGLTSITIPNSVTSIGDFAFSYCSGLTSVTVHNAEAVFGSDVFNGCIVNLRGYSGSTAETYAGSYSNITFVALMGTPDLILPASLKAIEAEAFSGISATVVYIPDSVTSLGSMAFANCTGLKEIRIPASVTVIPPDVFYGLTYAQLHGITVFGTPGSAAETYANIRGMKFAAE